MTKTARTHRPLRQRLVSVHRWLGLGAALFWLVQAVTGMAIVFHWEMRDAGISMLDRRTDLVAIEHRLDLLAPAGSKAAVGSIWTTAGFPERYDIFYTDATGADRSARIAGDGTVLRGPNEEEEGAILSTLVLVHHDLLAGATGEWVVGISGLLLLTNLIAGLVVAWPRRGTWGISLRPRAKGAAVARLYSWHRAFGLWLAVPALVIVGTGTMLRFETGLGERLGVEEISLPANPPAAGRPVGFAMAAGAALRAIPGSTLTSVSFPAAEDATYQFRVLAPGEIRRGYGASRVFVNANDGTLRGVFPIGEADAKRAFMSALFPIHTGEFGGLAGRFFALVLGAWLVIMIVIGGLLWLRRRPAGSKV